MKPLFLLLLSFCILQSGKSQTNDNYYYHRTAGAVSSGFSGTGSNIDVIYHKIYWRINPDSTVKYIKGYVQTNFITTVNNVNAISFDLNAVLLIDSVIFRNNKLSAGSITRTGNIFSIDLGTNLPLSATDSVTVFYQGTPPSPSASATGYVRIASASAGNYITTLSESYEDRDWWPCKADMQDKVDSMDVEVNVPWGITDTFWVACNGKLIDSTINGTDRTFKYSTRYPIATYLVFVSVAKFNRYYTGPVDVNGTQIPTAYYLLQGKTTTTYNNVLTAMDKMKPVLQVFSAKFGEYPFKLEKHGFFDGLSGASGMEHQTFSGMNSGALTSLRTLTHELMHQWFGDHVTFSTWNDLWLAEGFARYSECLVGELIPSLGINPFTTRNNFKNAALGLSGVSVWIPNSNILSSNTIWGTSYGQAIYERGAMIVSMLRAMCGDTKFYEALTNYQNNIGGSTATADSVKNYFNAVTGRDLTPFFNDYVGGSGNGAIAVGGIGNPVYVINWSNPSLNRLNVSVGSQTRTSGSNVSYFRGPVQLHIKGSIATEDTTITIIDWGSGNLSYAGNGISATVSGNSLTFDLSFTPVTVLFDDSSRTLSTGTTNKITLVPLRIVRFNAAKQAGGNYIDLLLEGDRAERVELWKSNDGINFQTAGEMNRSSNANQFNTTDVNAFAVSYYKAKIFSTGGYSFTHVVKVVSAMRDGLIISPNPAKDRILIKFPNWEAIPVTINIIDGSGRRVYEITTNDQQWQTTVRGLSPGVYVVQQIVQNKIVNREKLMVQ